MLKPSNQTLIVAQPSGPNTVPSLPRRFLVAAAVVLFILGVTGAATLISRRRDDRALAKESDESFTPIVAVAHATPESAGDELVLPGILQAYEESPIYARSNGYLVQWYKDIGTQVKQGDLLATIDSPELDQELSQARAGRRQLLAQLQLAQLSADRWKNLRKSDSVSQQETDQQTSGYEQAKAGLEAAEANIRRLEQLESFKNVYAPFSGVLTRRNVDRGALINSGSGGRELFYIANSEVLRMYVNLPEAYAPLLKLGASAAITLQEFPKDKFTGIVTRTSKWIDPSTRTLLTEIDVPNRGRRLLPGSFGQVHLTLDASSNKCIVPINSMLFRSDGAQVAVVGSDGVVHLRPITIGRDFGATLEILRGVSSNEQIIINPPDSIEDGQIVRIATSKQGKE